MRALPTWVKGFIYTCFFILALTEMGFGQADLSITAPASLTVPVGGSAALALTVQNLSTTNTATFPSLQVNLPAGVSYASFTASLPGVSCNQDGPVFCSLPDLAPSGTVTVTIFATAVRQGTYSATESVSFSGADSNPANNSASTLVTFTGGLTSTVATLLTDYETDTVQAYSGYPTPTPLNGGLSMFVGASPSNVVIAPNGRLEFVANINGSYISVVDLTIQAEIARIRDVNGWSIAITSDGQKLVSVGHGRDELDVIDIATVINNPAAAVTRISLDGKLGDVVGVNDVHPFSLALVGYQAYVANEFGPLIVVNFTTPAAPGITTVAGTAAFAALDLHAGHQVAATPDGSTVAVFGRPAGSTTAVVYLISTSNNALSQTVPTAFRTARTITITPNPNAASGVVAFLGGRIPSNAGVIQVLDLRNGSGTYGQVLASTVSLGTTITDMALTPDGATLQVVNGVFQGSTGAPGNLYTLNAASILTSPSTALLSTVTIPNSISVRGIAVGYVQTSPSPGAPQVSDVQPSEITNEAPKTVTIVGDNFAAGAMVRIGNLDPLPTTFVSRQQITVSVPAAAAVQLGTIVVTQPNSAAGPLAANVSGGGAQNGGTLRISPPASFSPVHPVAVVNYGNNLSLLFRDSALLPAGPFSPTLAIAPDGLYAYSGMTEVDITHLDTQQSLPPVLGPLSGSGTQAFSDCAGGSDNYAIAPDPTTGKKVLYLVSCDAATESSDTLYFVDVDPSSTTTRNTLLARTIQVPNTDFLYAQALAVTPDGRYVYSVDSYSGVNSTTPSRLVIFDVLNSTSTIIPDITTLGADPYQGHIQVAPDGHSLLLSGTGATTIKVYDIQGANALAPVLVTTITGSGAPTSNPPLLYWFQVVGTRLYAYASDQRFVQIFNFDRTTSNFAPLGSYVIPSAPGAFAGSAMAVTPEGSLIYAVVENEDAVAVLDANLVAASSPNALITKMRTAINPSNVAISPRSNATADLQTQGCAPSSTSSNSHCVTTSTLAATINQEAFVGFTVLNGGPSTVTGVTFTATLPAGLTLNSATANPSGVDQIDLPFACSGTTTVTCNLPNLGVYDSTQQKPGVLVVLGVTPTTSSNLVITGTVTANELDPNSANNTSSITLSAGADLAITATASPNPAVAGSPNTRTWVITNNGPDAASAVTVNVSSTAHSPTTFTTTQGTCTPVSAAYICSLGTISPGGQVTITFTTTYVASDASANGTVTLTGVVSAGTADPNTGNNSFSLDLTISISAGAPATEYLFTGDSATGELNVIDLTTNGNPSLCPNTGNPIATGCMFGGTFPDDILIAPNRHLAFVSHQAPYVSVVDLTIKREIQRIWTLGSTVHRIAMTPDGTKLLIPEIGSDTLAVVDLTQFPFQVSQRINLNGVGGNPALPAGTLTIGDLLVVGNKAYLGAENGSPLSGTNGPAINMIVVNLTTMGVSGTVAGTNTAAAFFSGKNMAATPDGSTVIVAQTSTDVNCVVPDRLLRISTSTDTVVNTLAMAQACQVYPVSPSTSNSLVYLKGFDVNLVPTVYQVNLGSGLALGNSVALPRNATRMVINSAGTKLYVTVNNVQSGPGFLPNVMVVDTGLLASNPASSVTAQFRSAMSMQATSIGFADLLPEPAAPTVSSVDPIIMVNHTPTAVSVFGSGFAAGATVKIGNLDPMVATFISANQLQVAVPAGVASQKAADIIVTNPNPGAALQSQVVSGALPVCNSCTFDSFQILNPVTFQPQYEVDALTLGDSNISILQQDRRNDGQTFLVPFNLYWPQGLVFSNDGSLMYVPAVTFNNPNFATSTLDIAAIGTGNNGQQSAIPVPGVFAGLGSLGSQTIAAAPNPANGQQVVYYAARAASSQGGFDRLNFLDADLSSPAANTFVDAMSDTTTAFASRNTVIPGALASTSDGRYLYSAADANLVIYDTLQRTVASFNAAAAGVGLINPVVAPDGRFLLLPSTTGQVMVFDISITPQTPSLLQTITSFTPNGMRMPFFNSYVLDCRDGCGFGFLYAYDESQNLVEVFHLGSYSFVNYFVVPGHHGNGSGTVALTPDGARLYAASYAEDTVAVLDANKLVTTATQNDPTVLVTKMATGLGPTTLAVNPQPLAAAPADLGVTISHTPSPVQLGANITYTVTISNSSSNDAQDGGFVIDLDPSLTLTYATFYDPNWIFAQDVPCTGTTHIVCSLGGKNNNCSGNNCNGCSGNNCGGGLPANFSTSVTVIAKTSSLVPVKTTITTTALIVSKSFDPNTDNNTATDTANVVAADLGVTMTASATSLAPGSNLVYTITVANNGPSASTGYTLTDTLPSNATFVSGSSSSGCTVVTATVTCAGGALGVGQSATFIIAVTPTAQGTLTNTTGVIGNEADSVPGNNTVTLQNFAIASDIAVTAAGAPSPVGGFPAYAATVTNNGPSDATNVVLTDLLDNYGFVSASSTQGSCAFSAPVVTCNLGGLANGTSAGVTVVVTAPNTGWAANTFHASAAQPDPNPVNNGARLGPPLDSFNTAVGSNVSINASDPADNLIAALTFSNVTRTGSTTMTPMSAASLPAGFRTGLQPAVFDISTNAVFAGALGLNIHFLPSNFRHPALVRLFHFEGGAWVDRTMGLNLASGVIAGQVMSLSPFALLEPKDTIPVANAGAGRSVSGAMPAGARVTLDGSASMDADGDPLTYRWSGPFPEGGGTVTGVSPTVTLPLGVSKVLLVVNDGEADSPAVAVNVAVADFQVSAPAASVALTRGQSTTFTITMTPQYGAFAAPINLSCAPGATDVTCSFTAASVTPGATAATATLTVTAASTVARTPRRSMPAYFALWLGTLPVFGVVLLAASRRKKRQMLLLLMLLLVLVASHIGCGGGGTTQTQSSSSSTPGSKAVTITVTGTSGTLQHSSAVTVTIPQ